MGWWTRIANTSFINASVTYHEYSPLHHLCGHMPLTLHGDIYLDASKVVTTVLLRVVPAGAGVVLGRLGYYAFLK